MTPGGVVQQYREDRVDVLGLRDAAVSHDSDPHQFGDGGRVRPSKVAEVKGDSPDACAPL